MDTAPRSRLSMPPVSGLAATGVKPLPSRMRICLPSREYTAPVGYHPDGMKPSKKLFAPLLMSTTATALISAFATSIDRPSGEIATELGVDVGGASANRFVEICSIASPENVSNTQTAALPPHATNSRLPSADSAMALGWSPAIISLTSSSESAVYT